MARVYATNIREFTPAYLEACFSYDPDTGKILWKARPLDHFNTERGCKTFNSSFVGRSYGGRLCGGYVDPSHIAWVLGTGEYPELLIDHINGDKLDNRLCNLRDVDNATNVRNAKLRCDNKTGTPGISYKPSVGRYVVQIVLNGKTYPEAL